MPFENLPKRRKSGRMKRSIRFRPFHSWEVQGVHQVAPDIIITGDVMHESLCGRITILGTTWHCVRLVHKSV